jgi:hypothetical protein
MMGSDAVNGRSTMFWHTETMPDDDRRFSLPSPAPERIDLASIKTTLGVRSGWKD